MFTVLHLDPSFVVIDKPAGFHVHRPELPGVRVERERVVLQQLRLQLGQMLYPVHRLDAATSGCLLLALNSQTAAALSRQMAEGGMRKIYRGMVRGHSDDDFEMSTPLRSIRKNSVLQPALTHARTLRRTEVPAAAGMKYASARYSLVEFELKTGRYHQIRRHCNRYNHPIVGDVEHGDRHHNRFLREDFGIRGLCLRAHALGFSHPETGERIEVVAPPCEQWKRIEAFF